METVAIIGLVVNLVLKVLTEIFVARKEAKERNKKFELDKKLFLELTDKAIVKIRQDLKTENTTIGNAEDTIDRNRGK